MKTARLLLPFLNPLQWIRAARFKRDQGPYARIRGDLELALYAEILHTDMLHYGYFDDPDVDPASLSFRDVERAQIRYAEVIAERIERADGSVLDVGCGMGGLSALLARRGLAVEAVTPNENQVRHIRARYPGMVVHACRFEELETRRSYDTIINAESLQYIDLDRALSRVRQLLRPGGSWIVVDYFRLRTDGRSRSGHLLDAFRSRLKETGWRVEQEVDITANCLPTLKLIDVYVQRILLPGARFGEAKLRTKYPRAYYLTERLRGALLRKAEKELAAVDPDRFADENRYMLFVLRPEGPVAIGR